MLAIYVAHAFGGQEENRAAATEWFRLVAEAGCAPVADWLILTSVWDESRKAEGLAINRALISRCDAVLLCGTVLSAGMKAEIEFAVETGTVILDAIGVTPDGVTRSLRAISAAADREIN